MNEHEAINKKRKNFCENFERKKGLILKMVKENSKWNDEPNVIVGNEKMIQISI